MAALSYDSVEILETFSDRAGITFPLLADTDYQVIDTFGLVNKDVEPDSPYYGFALAGYYLLDAEAVVTAKFFNEANNDRFTAANILVREFDAGAEHQGKAETRHLKLAWSVTNPAVRPGQRVALTLEIEPRRGMYLYAPGEHAYMAIDWELEPVDGTELFATSYPAGERKELKAIQETVPVYQKKLRLARDLHMLGGREWPPELEGVGELTLEGTLRYQACDARRCYTPATVPLKWTLQLEPHDLTRVPTALRRVPED